MEIRRSEPQDQPENVLPLINVVFLLLVFFMVAGALDSAEPFEITPPQAHLTEDSEGGPGVILLAAGGGLAFSGVEISPADLPQAVATFREETPEVPIRLKADGAIPADQVIALMDSLKAEGLDRLILITLPVEP